MYKRGELAQDRDHGRRKDEEREGDNKRQNEEKWLERAGLYLTSGDGER